jgi:hypothetical protein
MIRALIAAVGILNLASPAFAADTTVKSGSKSFKKQRCVTVPEIGTRLAKKRICMTEAEWRDMQQRTNTDMSQVQGQKPTHCPPAC